MAFVPQNSGAKDAFGLQLTQQRVVVMTDGIRMLSGNAIVNVFQVSCSDLVCNDLPHPFIDVRQNAASVKVPRLCDELLEESLTVSMHLQDAFVQVPSLRPA